MQKSHIVLKDDIFNANKMVTAGFAYFDPPYGSTNEKMPPSRERCADSSDTIIASVFEEFRKESNGDYLALNNVGDYNGKIKSRYR